MNESADVIETDDEIGAAYTVADTIDCNRSIAPRDLLHRLCVGASLVPQIVSHMVVEIHAANPRIDYRYNETFADHAIIVLVRWHSSGQGCRNSSCYGTYPKGKVCDLNSPATVFMTGKRIAVQACQPACFARQRQRATMRRAASTGVSLFTDNQDPRRCVECDSMNPLVTDMLLRHRLDSTYDLWDSRTREKVHTPPTGFHLRDGKGDGDEPDTQTDLPLVHWNTEESRCELSSETLLRQIVEPYWRAKNHSTCRLTNFTHGENVVPGYYSRDLRTNDRQTRDRNVEGFLQSNTETYCRAFGKNLEPDTGDCSVAWWETALTYTILGEGIFRLARNAIESDSGCMDDYFRPTREELGGDGEVDPFSARSLRQWRADVNLEFTLPPPNVTLRDLGIDVRLTGNRLYWNNYEGVLSHMAFFRTVETIDSGRGGESSSDDWRDRYANYNVNSSGATTNSSVAYRPTGDSVLAERFTALLANMENGGGDAGNGTPFGKKDVQRLIDQLNEMAARNKLLDELERMGLGLVGYEATKRLVSATKTQVKRLLQFLLRNLEGRAAGAFMRVGLRVGMSRMLGAVLSQLTAKLILAGSFAATGVGLLVSAAEFLSLVIDMALLFGWDPGNYNSYTSAESFRPLMDAYLVQSVHANQYELRPDTVLDLLVANTTDATDAHKTAANGTGTADAVPTAGKLERPDFSGDMTVDQMVNVPRWYNRRWANCFAATDAAGLASTEDGDTLAVSRIPLENDRSLWTQFYAWFYMGNLQTNSLGQLVRLDRQESDFDDARLADLVQEADYRDLTTVSVGHTVDNRSFNSRLTRWQAIGGTLIGVGSLVGLVMSLITLREASDRAAGFLLSLLVITLLSLVGIVVCTGVLHVFDSRYLAAIGRFDDNSNGSAVLASRIDPAARARSLSRIMRKFLLFT